MDSQLEKLLTVPLHDTQEFYNNLGGRSDENLALATALSIDNVVKAVVLTNPLSSTHKIDMTKYHSQGRRREPF